VPHPISRLEQSQNKKNGRPAEIVLFGVMSVGIFLNRYMNCCNNKNWLGVDAMQSCVIQSDKRRLSSEVGVQGDKFNQKKKQRDFVQQEDCVITMRI
jgi:hypothetical protein